MPHKDVAARASTSSRPTPRALGAVNCVVHRRRTARGHNTDGAGFVDALRSTTASTRPGRACVVLGAGGAARAVVAALAGAGAAEVVVVNRSRASGPRRPPRWPARSAASATADDVRPPTSS